MRSVLEREEKELMRAENIAALRKDAAIARRAKEGALQGEDGSAGPTESDAKNEADELETFKEHEDCGHDVL